MNPGEGKFCPKRTRDLQRRRKVREGEMDRQLNGDDRKGRAESEHLLLWEGILQ